MGHVDDLRARHGGDAESAGRRFEAAIQAARTLLESHPNQANALQVIGQSSLALGRPAEAIVAFHQAVEAEEGKNSYPLLCLGCAYAAAGDSLRARAILAQVLQLPDAAARAYPLALLYAALGDQESAFQWLERSIEQRSEDVVYAPSDAQIGALRSDPRLDVLMRRIGFPE